MDDFFEQGQTVTIQQTNQTNQNTQYNDDEFNFQSPDPQPQYNQFNQSTPTQQSNVFEQDENLRKMRQQQEKIQQKLRQKAQKQYEEKEKRKEKGRAELEEFLERKQRQKQQRKQQNLKIEQSNKQNNLDLDNGKSSWKKVAANIKLKQGQHVGTKDVNRMRQAIINKKNDQQ